MLKTLSAFAMLAALLIGCGGDDGQDPDDPPSTAPPSAEAPWQSPDQGTTSNDDKDDRLPWQKLCDGANCNDPTKRGEERINPNPYDRQPGSGVRPPLLTNRSLAR